MPPSSEKEFYEKEIMEALRDIRAHLATLNKKIVESKDDILVQFQLLSNSLDKERLERRVVEFQEAQQRADIRKKMVDEASTNGVPTTEKIKKEVATQFENRKLIDWNELLRKNIIPTVVTIVTAALVTAALGVIFPAFGHFLVSAFSGK